MGARQYVSALVLTLLVASVAGCGIADKTSLTHKTTPPKCRPAVGIVPKCGVIWGVATEPNTRQYLQTVEQRTNRRFDMVYRFHDINDQIPTADERALVEEGRILHVSIDARVYGLRSPAITWRDVASGQYDDALTRAARGIASLGVPVFVTFDHEPDQTNRAARGSPADFVAAWRHVHDVFIRAGATNAVWVWVVTGYPPTFRTAGQTWPGNAYVDWISWEAYNASGCRSGRIDPSQYEGFAASALPFYRWINIHGPSLGIDTSKPMMISESASVIYQSDPRRAAQWYREIPAVLKAHPQIQAIGLWDRPGNGACRYQFDYTPTVIDAVSRASLQSAITGR